MVSIGNVESVTVSVTPGASGYQAKLTLWLRHKQTYIIVTSQTQYIFIQIVHSGQIFQI